MPHNAVVGAVGLAFIPSLIAGALTQANFADFDSLLAKFGNIVR
jgi:hypothetical protein